jgi:DNA primase
VGRIPDETIEAIRNRVDVVDLVGRHVSLRQKGRSFWGLCPFHGEKTPSFHVHPERQIFHCFGCGAGGDAFRFLMRLENLSYPEAIRVLAAQCGIEVPETEAEAGQTSERRRLREATAAAQSFYRSALAGADGQPARDYLARRGIDVATAQRFGLGFAPAAGTRSRARSSARRSLPRSPSAPGCSRNARAAATTTACAAASPSRSRTCAAR